MNRETARQEIRSRISCANYLKKSKGGLYVCPCCRSGTREHGTGAVKFYEETNTWYCHECHKGGDVIALYRQVTGVGYNKALSLLAQEIGESIDPYMPDAPQEATGDRRNGDIPPARKTPQNGSERATADYMPYYQECSQRLNDPAAKAYLQQRGISYYTAAAYLIGFDPAADPANAPGAGADVKKPHPCPRLIIPTSRSQYVGRRIDGKKEYDKMNSKNSTPGIFNERVLYAPDVQEVFVVEGAFDALSVIEVGAAAIALNGAGNGKILLEHLQRRRTDATLILCRDNDPNPKTAEQIKKEFDELAAGLKRLNIGYITANISAGYKDPNEALTGNKAAFIEEVERARRQTAAKPDNTAYYIDNLMRGEIERFKNERKTGFRNLDAKADGLYGGLYVLAAISSLGKTSFALQLADQLAERGNDVMFFSLEQSKLELVSKSLARRTAQKSLDNAVSSLSIRKGYLPKRVMDAVQEYKESVADRISIVEGNFNCNISFIGEHIRQYIRRNGNRPVVFIDYLQILKPADDMRWKSTKEAMDSTVTELKHISRELDLPVIVISSVNRANYLTPIDFESLKESGGIEFTADVVWGLQLQCLSEEGFKSKDIPEKRKNVKKAKAETPRKIELCCLKNRYGIANYSCYFEYFPANDLFKEQSEAEAELEANDNFNF